MLKRFEDLLEFIGANKKIEIIKIVLVNVVGIAIAILLMFLTKQIMLIFIGIIVVLGGNYVLFSSYTTKKRAILMDRENEFISMIGYFQFFISNSYNVYQSFQALIAYATPWMEEQLNSLILEIDNDKSVKPFVNFANKFTSKVTSNVMLSIYQMVEEGENGIHMLQFNALFQQLSKNHQKESNLNVVFVLHVVVVNFNSFLILLN